MVEIKKIEVLSLAKIIALVWIFLGFIVGLGAGMLSFLIGNIMGGMFGNAAPGQSAWLGIGGFLIVPLLFGVVGFITGLLTAWFYNLLAWWVGGIRVEIEDENAD